MILDKDLIQKINLFERLTKARVKEVFNSNGLLIVVNIGDIGKAVGKNGEHIKKYSHMINEKVKVVEFNSNPIIFLKNMVMPLKLDNVEKDDGFINISADTKTKALLIGRNQKNLERYNKILKKYFDLKIRIK
ncbi:NusA-like transcription termination signal-binding factor [Candidatus Woesearchaeota archaeon]|nr:NusA-like transcription termination signal-binding factor [Candidatus Woesearchaeota archaeon]